MVGSFGEVLLYKWHGCLLKKFDRIESSGGTLVDGLVVSDEVKVCLSLFYDWVLGRFISRCFRLVMYLNLSA